MATIQQAIKDINGVRSIFAARGTSSSSDGSLHESFAVSLVTIIDSMQLLSTTDASQIFAALRDNPYGDEHSKRIRDKVDSVV